MSEADLSGLGARTLGRRSGEDTDSCWPPRETAAVGGATMVASFSLLGKPFLWVFSDLCGLLVMVAESLVL